MKVLIMVVSSASDFDLFLNQLKHKLPYLFLVFSTHVSLKYIWRILFFSDLSIAHSLFCHTQCVPLCLCSCLLQTVVEYAGHWRIEENPLPLVELYSVALLSYAQASDFLSTQCENVSLVPERLSLWVHLMTIMSLLIRFHATASLSHIPFYLVMLHKYRSIPPCAR